MFYSGVLGVLVCAVLAAPAFAETPAKVSPFTFANGASSSGWLPFEYFAGTRIFIQAQVNGRPTKVMLDSGASSTVLDKRFAAALGLKAVGDLTGEGGGGSTAYSEVRGVDLKLGDLSWTGGTAVAIDLTAVERQIGHPMPVVLGGEMFRDAVVDIDFKGRRISFNDPARYRAPALAKAVPLTPSHENQAIVATIEGRPATLLFDLGNGSALSLYPRFWDQPAFRDARRMSSTMTGGVGGMHVEKLAMVGTLELGGATFKRLPASLESATSSAAARAGNLDGNIGMRVLSRFHLIVDFPHSQVLFAPPADTATPFAINRSGLTLQPTAEGSKVLYVAPDSAGAAAGLQAGDVIVAVDDVAADAKPATGRAWLSEPAGKVVRLKLAGGQVKALKLADAF